MCATAIRRRWPARCHGNGADPIGARGAHIVRMIADERNCGVARAIQPSPPGLPDGDAHQTGAIFRHFGKRAKTEIRPQPGALHFLPSDAGQISCYQSDDLRRAPARTASGERRGKPYSASSGARSHINRLGSLNDVGIAFRIAPGLMPARVIMVARMSRSSIPATGTPSVVVSTPVVRRIAFTRASR